MRANSDEQERETFYDQLETLVKSHDTRRTHLVIAGDFNSKVGKSTHSDQCMGPYTRGRRNENGHRLVEFCQENELILANSLFRHRACHMTTWVGSRQDKETKKTVPIYNQIDYILVKQHQRANITNARAYSGTTTNSDHRLVIMTLNLKFRRATRQNAKTTNKYNTPKLANDENVQKEYQADYDERRKHTQLDPLPNPQSKLAVILDTILEAASAKVGIIKPTNNKYDCPIIAALSVKQKELRAQIQNSTCPSNKREKLKSERNQLLHKIKKQAVLATENRLDQLASEIEKTKDSARMFEAARALTRLKPKDTLVQREDGSYIANATEAAQHIADYFASKLSVTGKPPLNPKNTSGPLIEPLSRYEVEKAVKSLRNRRAVGPDKVPSELLKYGSNQLHQDIADVLNQSLQQGDELDIGGGTLIALQKDGKPRGPVSSLRPIVLLTALRKMLSIITLNRIRSKVEEFLSPGQSGFRQNRSTTDAVWAHKWLVAAAQKHQIEIEILGIDMTSAFDTIDRQKLLDNTKEVFGDDAWRMTVMLLNNTSLQVNFKKALSAPFLTNIGSPQGDSLSPVLFTVYLECALRQLRREIEKPVTDVGLPSEIIYADDVDFVSRSREHILNIESAAPRVLAEWNLKVNPLKTEHLTISRLDNRAEESWRLAKKLGTLLGDSEELERRRRLGAVALSQASTLWKRSTLVSESKRIRLYKACVKPIITYNFSTWALTQSELNRLDSFHRRQLRTVIGVRYPNKISNEDLYARTNSEPLSHELFRARWRMLGHALRMNSELPAKEAMSYYFRDEAVGYFRGQPRTTIATAINKDLADIYNAAASKRGRKRATIASLPKKLLSNADLCQLETLARDRKKWKSMIVDAHALLSAKRI